jgi:hypothetical protein
MGVKGRNTAQSVSASSKDTTPRSNRHKELCEAGAKFLRRKAPYYFRKPFVLIEFCPIGGESPDVFGLDADRSLLIEVKASREDFLRDKLKPHRQPGKGIGYTRYYLCPTDLIKEEELPDGWGLFYADEMNNISCVKESKPFTERDYNHELTLMQSVIRRLHPKYGILDFRKEGMKDDEENECPNCAGTPSTDPSIHPYCSEMCWRDGEW